MLKEKGHYTKWCPKKEREQLHTTLSAKNDSDDSDVEHIFHQNKSEV